MPKTDLIYIAIDRLAYDTVLIEPEGVAAWNKWYDDVHLPDVCGVIGAHTATRWQNMGVQHPAQFFTVYEIEGHDGARALERLHAAWPKWWAEGRVHPRHNTVQSALVRPFADYDPVTKRVTRERSKEGAALRHTAETRAISLIFSHSNNPAKEKEWNDWYMATHTPESIKTGAFSRNTRCERALPPTMGGNMEAAFTHLAIYDIDRDPNASPVDWKTIEWGWENGGLMNHNHTGTPSLSGPPVGKYGAIGYRHPAK